METKCIQTVVSFKTVDRSYVRSEFIEMEYCIVINSYHDRTIFQLVDT